LKSEIYWIDGAWKGRLGIAARPRGGDWLEDEVRAWRRDGVQTVVSLLERDEEKELDLDDERSLAEREGLEFLSLPIHDRGLPASLQAMRQMTAELEQQLKAGRSVLVHCRQGIGRSSMMAGAVLVQSGVDGERALEAIARARRARVPDTEEQRQWLLTFAETIAALQSPRKRAAGD
jgi:protein-tyrosine phosphatase